VTLSSPELVDSRISAATAVIVEKRLTDIDKTAEEHVARTRLPERWMITTTRLDGQEARYLVSNSQANDVYSEITVALRGDYVYSIVCVDETPQRVGRLLCDEVRRTFRFD
jgi:hypothetical protein